MCIPLIINTYLTAMVLPSLVPELGAGTFPVSTDGSFAKELFFSHPYIYTLLYHVIDFVMTGLYGCLALVISRLVNNRYIVMFFPFIVFLAFQTVITYTPLALLGPYYIMDPHQIQSIEEIPYILASISALLLITVIGFKLTGGKKHDSL